MKASRLGDRLQVLTKWIVNEGQSQEPWVTAVGKLGSFCFCPLLSGFPWTYLSLGSICLCLCLSYRPPSLPSNQHGPKRKVGHLTTNNGCHLTQRRIQVHPWTTPYMVSLCLPHCLFCFSNTGLLLFLGHTGHVLAVPSAWVLLTTTMH
jgi:hypothetical protein